MSTDVVATSVAPTPPMGWNSWNAHRTRIDEDLILGNARAMVERGLRDAGYEYVVVDDGWQAPRRASSGELVPDPDRFPHGMEWLVEQIQALGLKAGLYASPGAQTCAMLYDAYPGEGLGSFGHEEQDITTYARWGIDYLKYDWCEAERSGLMWREKVFEKMADQLRQTGRPMVFSISEYGQHSPWRWAPRFANCWRTTADIEPSFSSVLGILRGQRGLEQFAGPGHWNDPDMLQVGNPGMDAVESRSHFGLWALLAAPLMAGNELTTMSEQTAALLTHPGVIALNQDPLGAQASFVLSTPEVEVLRKPLSQGCVAWGVLNAQDAEPLTVTLTDGGLRVLTPRGEHVISEPELTPVGPTASHARPWEAKDVWTGAPTTGGELAPHDLGLFVMKGER